MRHIQRVASNLNLDRLALQVRQNDHRFVKVADAVAGNPDHPAWTHREVEVITLRATPVKSDFLTNAASRAQAEDEIMAAHTEAWHVFSEVRPVVYDLMRLVSGAQLGRVSIVRINPGAAIYPHVDGGMSTEFYTRYHVMVHGHEENWSLVGDEKVEMLSGEIWTFDGKQVHSFRNFSKHPRIHVNVDIS